MQRYTLSDGRLRPGAGGGWGVWVLCWAELPRAAAALPQADTPLLPRRACAGGWAIVACVVGLTFFAALSWTPINYETIFGVQGRYWLPVLPLALVLLGNGRTFTAQRSVARPAALATVCLTSLVILQGAGLYAAWQMS